MVLASVLVVDDDPDIRESLGSILTEEGYFVRTARNGVEALQRMADQPPDLVLLDLMMPVLDGWHVMRIVRADPRLRHTPIIVLSALSGLECAGYVQKPISLPKLIGLLEMVRKRTQSN
jgi:CheY-like chemotaxis protein